MPVPSTALTEPTQAPDLPTLIMEVAEPVWRKISSALQVKTRQQAVQLVQADQQAATIVSEIIRTATTARSALTEGSRPAASALTYAPPVEPIADRLYGGGGKARLKIG